MGEKMSSKTDNGVLDSGLKSNAYGGHRQRLKNQFRLNGFSGMSDQNVLELILFYAIPRRDTYEIADSLIQRFGSLERVFEASFDELTNVKGISDNAACLIQMILPAYKRYLDCMMRDKHSFATTHEMAEYLRGRYIGDSSEKVLMLCFDSRMKLINCCTVCEGNISSASFDMRRVVEIAISQRASYVVLSHNHPHGIAAPSAADITTTFKVAGMLKAIKVKLTDHIIVSFDDYYAMADDEKNRQAFM